MKPMNHPTPDQRVSEAAERVRQHAATNLGNAKIEDRNVLVQAYLAEHDPTPIDEAWLRSVGFSEYGTFIDGWGGHEGGLRCGCLEWHCKRDWRIDGRVFATGTKTRGDVLTLCRALRITLKETL